MKIGIDIGGSHIASGIVLDNGKLIGKDYDDINIMGLKSEEEIKELIIDVIQGQIKFLLSRYDYNTSDISKIGIAIPGDINKNIARNVVNLHITNFDIVDRLKNIYNKEIKIKNDGKCAGLAEKKYGSLKVLYLWTENYLNQSRPQVLN